MKRTVRKWRKLQLISLPFRIPKEQTKFVFKNPNAEDQASRTFGHLI